MRACNFFVKFIFLLCHILKSTTHERNALLVDLRFKSHQDKVIFTLDFLYHYVYSTTIQRVKRQSWCYLRGNFLNNTRLLNRSVGRILLRQGVYRRLKVKKCTIVKTCQKIQIILSTVYLVIFCEQSKLNSYNIPCKMGH